jgi:hypothetical protein
MRWSDNDRYFGPFTYSRGGYCPFALVLGSGDGDENPGCRLRMSGFGHTLIIALPQIIRPWRRKVKFTHCDEATLGRIGQDWYWDCHEREYGFSLSTSGRVGDRSYDFLQVFFGRQTHDSSTDQNWCWFLPWKEWRHVRHSFYGHLGEHVATLPDTGKSYRSDPGRFDRERVVADATPTRTFAFADYDGEELTATMRIEEREWRRGKGWFKWLSWFYKPMIQRSLDIEFSGETGDRKGSWKGGTLDHSIKMLPGELHEAAFRHYCNEHNMTFIGMIVE